MEDNRNRKWKLRVYGCTVKKEHAARRKGKKGRLQTDKTHGTHIRSLAAFYSLVFLNK